MANPDEGLPKNGRQTCPTRIDRTPVLLAHKVTREQCQDRQRGHYHKCFTCVYNNGWAGKQGWPEPNSIPREIRRDAPGPEGERRGRSRGSALIVSRASGPKRTRAPVRDAG